MERYQTIFIIIYLAVLFCYFFTETSGKMKYRAPNKILLSTLFLGYAAAAFFRHCDPYSYSLLLLFAIFLAWSGDVYLLWDINRGGDLFLCSNMAFFVYEIALAIDTGLGFRDLWWSILLFATLWAAMLRLAIGKKAKLGRMAVPAILYATSVMLHGTLGLALAVNAGKAAARAPELLLLGSGLALFMVSDGLMALRTAVFKKNKIVPWLNTGTYYIGLLLVVLSLSF
jgi:hypothetical protein